MPVNYNENEVPETDYQVDWAMKALREFRGIALLYF